MLLEVSWHWKGMHISFFFEEGEGGGSHMRTMYRPGVSRAARFSSSRMSPSPLSSQIVIDNEEQIEQVVD